MKLLQRELLRMVCLVSRAPNRRPNSPLCPLKNKNKIKRYQASKAPNRCGPTRPSPPAKYQPATTRVSSTPVAQKKNWKVMALVYLLLIVSRLNVFYCKSSKVDCQGSAHTHTDAYAPPVLPGKRVRGGEKVPRMLLKSTMTAAPAPGAIEGACPRPELRDACLSHAPSIILTANLGRNLACSSSMLLPTLSPPPPPRCRAAVGSATPAAEAAAAALHFHNGADA